MRLEPRGRRVVRGQLPLGQVGHRTAHQPPVPRVLVVQAYEWCGRQAVDVEEHKHVRTVGDHFERQLRALALKHTVIIEVRGAGLMRALDLRIDSTAVIDLARERGLLLNRTDTTAVRMLPPLNIEAADLDRAVENLDGVLAAVAMEVPA